MPAQLCVVAEDLKTGPHMCAMNALSRDQSPQLQCSSVSVEEAASLAFTWYLPHSLMDWRLPAPLVALPLAPASPMPFFFVPFTLSWQSRPTVRTRLLVLSLSGSSSMPESDPVSLLFQSLFVSPPSLAP